MNCHAIRAVLDLHAEGRLTKARTKAVDAHLASCAACRELARPAAAPSAAPAPKDFKARLAAAMKTAPAAPAPRAALSLWPRDFSSVALAAAGLILIAAVIGWSGVPSQRDSGGDELAAGRIP